MTNSISEKVGYISGVLEEVRDDVRQQRQELRDEFAKLYEQFGDHIREDKERFGSLGKQIEELREYQAKQRWWFGGAAGVIGLLTTLALFADRMKGLFPGLFGP
jgi:hypothetical protein